MSAGEPVQVKFWRPAKVPNCQAWPVIQYRNNYALQNLKAAIQEVEIVVEAMHTEKDPLAIHIFVSRRNLRDADTKSGAACIAR